MPKSEQDEKLPPTVAAKNLGPETALLQSFGISAARIASLLGTSPANIRQIASRAQFPRQSDLAVPAPPVREARFEEFLLYGKKRQALELLEKRVEEIFQQYSGRY